MNVKFDFHKKVTKVVDLKCYTVLSFTIKTIKF